MILTRIEMGWNPFVGDYHSTDQSQPQIFGPASFSQTPAIGVLLFLWPFYNLATNDIAAQGVVEGGKLKKRRQEFSVVR